MMMMTMMHAHTCNIVGQHKKKRQQPKMKYTNAYLIWLNASGFMKRGLSKKTANEKRPNFVEQIIRLGGLEMLKEDGILYVWITLKPIKRLLLSLYLWRLSSLLITSFRFCIEHLPNDTSEEPSFKERLTKNIIKKVRRVNYFFFIWNRLTAAVIRQVIHTGTIGYIFEK